MPGQRLLRTEFKRELRHRFTMPLTSANRLKLILSVLEAPVQRPAGPSQRAGGVGGGLDLEALQSSGRVHEVFLMHDDDESEVTLTTTLTTTPTLALASALTLTLTAHRSPLTSHLSPSS